MAHGSWLIRVGRIGKPHGVRGEVTVLVETDDDSRFQPGAVLHRDAGPDLVVLRSRRHRDQGMIVAFDSVPDRNAAEVLRGTVLRAEAAARRPTLPGEFWAADLLGLVAVSPEGTVLGEIGGVESGVGQDRLVVITPEGKRVLIPFVAALVGEPTEGRLEITDPGGLF